MRFGASSCRFTGAGTSFLRATLADPFECAGAAFGGWPFSSGLLGLPSQRLGGSRLMPLALEGMDNRLGALRRGLVRVAAMTLGVSAGGTPAGLFGSLSLGRRRQVDSRLAGFREPDGNRLLRRSSAVFPAADMLDFFADELAGLRRRRFPLALVFAGAF